MEDFWNIFKEILETLPQNFEEMLKKIFLNFEAIHNF